MVTEPCLQISFRTSVEEFKNQQNFTYKNLDTFYNVPCLIEVKVYLLHLTDCYKKQHLP